MTNITHSAQQEAIFDWFKNGKGNLIVRARAGTGKTYTLLHGITFAPEAKILLAAFNKRIQVELDAKLRNENAQAKTLHSLGYSFLMREWGKLTPDNKVEDDRINRAIPELPAELFGNLKKLVALIKNCAPFGTTEQIVQLAFTYNCAPDYTWEDEGITVEKFAEMALKVVKASHTKDAQGRITFDDMVYLPLALNIARPWFNMVVVDEAQDMNAAQLLLAQRACKRGGRICLVGDDRQAIYGFRGADSGSLDRLKVELNAAELGLTITYRCPKSVVAMAAELVPDYQAAPSAPEGIVCTSGYDKMFQDAQIGDFILSRTNAPLIPTCLGFLRAGRSARIEGKDIGANLKNIVKKLKAKSIETFIEKVNSWKTKQTAVMLAKNADEKVIEGVKDQAETLIALAEGAASVNEIVTRIENLFQDSEGNPRPAIILSSVHKAKGLESNTVYTLEDTFKRSGGEENNIRYVAITRAKQTLVLVSGTATKKD